MLQGPSFEMYNTIISNTSKEDVTLSAVEMSSLKLIASGGISTFDELPKLVELGCEGVIIGKAIYENKISLKQLEHFILNS
jgi:phosphoribosylformimino-5-aminoimidazole carboxamide ribotide isomerase